MNRNVWLALGQWTIKKPHLTVLAQLDMNSVMMIIVKFLVPISVQLVSFKAMNV